MTRILHRFNRGPVRTWRRNAGKAWQGEHRWQPDGSLLLLHPRPVLLGEANLLDLQGWVQIGDYAVYLELDAKRVGGSVSSGQHKRIAGVRKAGGVAFWADSEDMAVSELERWTGVKL